MATPPQEPADSFVNMHMLQRTPVFLHGSRCRHEASPVLPTLVTPPPQEPTNSFVNMHMLQHSPIPPHRRRRQHKASRFRRTIRGPLSEFLGSLLLFMLGFAGSITAETSSNATLVPFIAPLCWGLGVMVGMLASSPSGSHLNPGVTLTLAIFRQTRWRQVPVYMAAQFLGALAGTFIAFGLNIDKVHGATLGNASEIGRLFWTRNDGITLPVGFLNEFAAAITLMFTVFTVEAHYRGETQTAPSPMIIGALITALALGFGANTSACLNPWRDLAPRIVAAIAGAGWKEAFGGEMWRWILLGPFAADIGGLICGAALWTICFAKSDKDDHEYWKECSGEDCMSREDRTSTCDWSSQSSRTSAAT